MRRDRVRSWCGAGGGLSGPPPRAWPPESTLSYLFLNYFRRWFPKTKTTRLNPVRADTQHGASRRALVNATKKDTEEPIMSSNNPKRNRNDQAAADQSLLDGINKHSATIPAIFIAGAAVPLNDIVTTLQARIEAAKNVQPAKATWLAAVQADRDQHAESATLVAAFKQTLSVFFAGQVQTLADFGLAGRKPTVVSPETRVAAAAKAKATREARHTMGKKQKAKIKGTAPAAAPEVPPAATPPAAAPVAATPKS
jgi:hypothetical protein